MISQEQWAAFLDGALDHAQHAAVDLTLQRDAEALQFVVEQRKMDRVLGSLLAPPARKQRIRTSILAAVTSASAEQLRAEILAETSSGDMPLPQAGSPAVADQTSSAPQRTFPTKAPDLGCLIRTWIESLPQHFRASRMVLAATAFTVLLLGLIIWQFVLIPKPIVGLKIGTIAKVIGTTELSRQGQSSASRATSGTVIRLGDRLATGDADQAEIQFLDGTTLHLSFNTAIEIPTPQSVIRNPQSVMPLLAILTVKEGSVDFFNAFGTVQATAMTESTAQAGSAPTEPKRLETLQVVRLDNSNSWSLLTSALDWPEAAVKFVGGGGSVGWQLREVRRSDGVADIRVSHLPASSRAAQAGVQIGDVLTEFDGQPVASARQLASAILRRPNETIPFRLRRGDLELAVSIAVEPVESVVDGPELSAESHAPLAALLAKWTSRPAAQTVSPAEETHRSEEIARFSRAVELRAAAFNQLGVVYELEDALGPAIRAYGRAVYLAPQVPLYHFNLGLALRKIGSFERALEECEAAARLEPASVPARKRVAEIHSLLGRHTEALTLTEALLEAAPQDHGAWELKSQLLLKLGRPIDSVAPARRAVELDPECPVAHAYLAEALHAAGQLDDAESAYAETLDRAPLEAVFHMNYGNLLRDQNQWAAAERSFHRAIELRPDFALAYCNLGNVLADRRDYESATAAFEKAIELDPADVTTHLRLGDMALKQRQFAQAERAYHHALEIAPHNADLYYGLGEVCRLQRRPADAERAYRKAIELQPNHAAAHTALGIVFYDRGDVDEAERLYRKALELDPDNLAPYGNLGIIYAERKQFAEAEKTFRALLERSSGNARLPALVNLAAVCGEQGKLDEAERLFRQALELAPNHPRVGNSLASFLADHRLKLNEALALATRAVQSAPNDPNFLDTLGWVQAQRGDLEAAERTLQRALDLAGEEPPADEVRKHLQQVREETLTEDRHSNPNPTRP